MIISKLFCESNLLFIPLGNVDSFEVCLNLFKDIEVEGRYNLWNTISIREEISITFPLVPISRFRNPLREEEIISTATCFIFLICGKINQEQSLFLRSCSILWKEIPIILLTEKGCNISEV